MPVERLIDFNTISQSYAIEVACPKCKVEPMKRCRTKSGNYAQWVHESRIKAWQNRQDASSDKK